MPECRHNRPVRRYKIRLAGVNEHQPDLFLLDIKMPDVSGFDLLKHFDKPDFKIIFVSAFDKETIRAIKLGCIEFLTKPINLKDLFEAIKHAEKDDQQSLMLKLKALKVHVRKSGK